MCPLTCFIFRGRQVIVKTAGQLMAEAGGDGEDKERYVRMDESQMKILDDLPSSAVELQVKEKFLQKLHRQERVVEEVKLALKPFYNRKHVSKEDYKLIMKKCVPKVSLRAFVEIPSTSRWKLSFAEFPYFIFPLQICHNRHGEINPAKIKALVEGYVKKFRHLSRKHKQAAPQPAPSNPATAGSVGNS